MTEKEYVPLTMQEVENELNGMGLALGSHEQTLFHTVATLNALQRVLVEKKIATNEELVAIMSDELTKLQNAFVEHMQKQNAAPVDTEAANG